MRFEIKTGGVIAILMGVAVLSGAVFVLGLLAGYDVGRESQLNTAQTAETYSVPASDGSAVQPLSQARAAPGIEPVARDAHAAAPPAPVQHIAPASNPAQRTASAQPPSAPPEGPATERAAAANVTAPSGNRANSTPERTASAEHPAAEHPAAAPAEARPVRRRPYNIQIEAAMDINGADAMMMRLQKLGYTPHLTTTTIDGHTWFKVEVGPYATQREAEEAQAELREKYDAAYAPHSPSRSASDNDTPNSAGDDSE